MIRQPQFWQNRLGLALLLLPLSALWWLASKLRHLGTKPYKSSLPVICIGNVSIGGTGKTPTALFIARVLTEAGWRPAILSRGYGGAEAGPCWVDKDRHKSSDVGDEPLLLSRQTSVCVSRNRARGARFIENSQNYDIIIMDDGLQNPQLSKDIILGVFDGGVGIGNGWLVPAGPLREAFSSAIKRCDAILINGSDKTQLANHLPSKTPLFHGRLEPTNDSGWMANQKLYAFAGIGRPERFFESLEALGADVIGNQPFADHHQFTAAELTALEASAKSAGAQLITTDKDWQRIPIDWQDRMITLPVSLTLIDEGQDALIHFLTHRLKHVIS